MTGLHLRVAALEATHLARCTGEGKRIKISPSMTYLRQNDLEAVTKASEILRLYAAEVTSQVPLW